MNSIEKRQGSTPGRGKLNFVYVEKFWDVNTKPDVRVPLKIFCPQALKVGSCDGRNVIWHCQKCEEVPEFGFDGFFYCQCGKARLKYYKYRCANRMHRSFTEFDENVLSSCLEQMQVNKSMNILLLGKSGVGKTTCLNSIMNYLTYDTLEEAESHRPRVLLPASFNSNHDYVIPHQLVRFRAYSDGEVLETGQEIKQFPRTYSFPWQDRMVRIVDTPGVGTGHNVEEDLENFRVVLDHISHFNELHGICILLDPNENGILFFGHYIINLLAKFHKSAARNIVFCFTNTRNTCYEPGYTYTLMKDLLHLLDAEVALSEQTVYCMDNESLAFLCSIGYPNITYSHYQRHCFTASWENSARETKRMLAHIQQLKPHRTADTILVNNVRRFISTFAKPIADLTSTIIWNITAIVARRKEIRQQRIRNNFLTNLSVPSMVLTQHAYDLKKEVDIIYDISLRLMWFLKEHALVPCNDAVKSSLIHKIKKEKNKSDISNLDKEMLRKMELLLYCYDNAISEVIPSLFSGSSAKFCSCYISMLIRSLHNLPFSGDAFKRAEKAAEKRRKKNICYSEQSWFLIKNQTETSMPSIKNFIRSALSYVMEQLF